MINHDNVEHLQHYASPYYDPVKAHEYYMKNRELKGRRSTSKLSDEGKKAWAYTKNEITTEKKEKVEVEKETQKQQVAELRDKASATRERISARLKELNEALSKKASQQKENIETNKKSDLERIERNAASKREEIEARRKTAIEKLMDQPLPAGLTKAEKAKRIAERDEKIAKLRSSSESEKSKLSDASQSEKESARTNAANQKQKVTENTKAERSSNSSDASAQRQQVSVELKTAISAAREAYKAAKESIDSTYEEIFQREFDRIAAEMPKVSKRKKSSKKKSSRK